MAHQGSDVDLQPELVKLSHVGEEETQEGQGCEPLTHSADHMCCVALKQGRTSSSFSLVQSQYVSVCTHIEGGVCVCLWMVCVGSESECVNTLLWVTFSVLTHIYSAFHFLKLSLFFFFFFFCVRVHNCEILITYGTYVILCFAVFILLLLSVKLCCVPILA